MPAARGFFDPVKRGRRWCHSLGFLLERDKENSPPSESQATAAQEKSRFGAWGTSNSSLLTLAQPSFLSWGAPSHFLVPRNLVVGGGRG